MSKLLQFLEITGIYLLVLILLWFVVGDNFLSMDYQPNLYLVTFVALTLYFGFLPAVIGVAGYLLAHLAFFKYFPRSQIIYTFVVFGSLSLFFYLLNTKRTSLLQERVDFYQEKIDELLKNYYFLKVSYEQVSKRYMIDLPLRDIIEELKRTIGQRQQNQEEKTTEIYEGLKTLLFNEFDLQSFAIYFRERDGKYVKAFSTDNYKVLPEKIWQDVIKKVELKKCIIKAADVVLETEGFLSCIPILDESESIKAILIIQKMGFKAYNLENLQLIGIILLYFFRYLSGASGVIISAFDEEFNRDLSLTLKTMKSYNVDSTIVIIKGIDLPDDILEELYKYIQRYTRTYDSTCIYNKKLIVLLHLTNVQEAELYVNKIKGLIGKNWTINVEENLSFKLVPLTTEIEKLKRVLEDVSR